MADNGLAAFKARLARVPEQVRAEVNAANKKNAEEWVALAQAAAPADPIDGVFLRPSIRMHVSDTGGWVVRAGGTTTTRESAGGPFDYARAQEFGRPDMPANPFFWTTYRLLKRKFNSRRRRALNKAIKKFHGG